MAFLRQKFFGHKLSTDRWEEEREGPPKEFQLNTRKHCQTLENYLKLLIRVKICYPILYGGGETGSEHVQRSLVHWLVLQNSL